VPIASQSVFILIIFIDFKIAVCCIFEILHTFPLLGFQKLIRNVEYFSSVILGKLNPNYLTDEGPVEQHRPSTKSKT